MHKRLVTNKTNLLAFENIIDLINIDKPSIIIVPDKFSLSAEQMFFERKNIKACFNTRVFSLTKLASIILEEKLRNKKLIDKNISLMIISSIIEENLNNFKYFTNIKDTNQITEDVFNVISQILTSNKANFNENLDNTLKNKVDDLNLIYDEYLIRREDYLIDASRKYDMFIENIEDSEFIKNNNFYFGMFNSLTSQVKDIIKKIAKTSCGTTFSASKSDNRVNNNEIYEFYKSLKIDEEISFNNKQSEIVGFIEQNFFNGKNNKFKLINNEVKLIECKNITEEILQITREIKKDILINGLRFKDISICVGELKNYADEIKKEFNKQNYSYFIDETISLSETSYARFFLDFLNIFIFCNNKKMIGLIKNYYINIDEDIKNNYEKFILKYSLLELDAFKKIDNLDFDELYKDYIFVFNNYINKICELKQNLSNISLYYFFEKVNKLLKEFGASEKLQEKIDGFRNCDILKLKQLSQIENKILDCQNHIIDFYKQEFNIKKVYNFLKLCFDNTNISVPATSVDSIFIGDCINSYFKKSKKLYVLGCDNKNFPNLKQDTSLFTDSELSLIEKNFLIEPKVRDINRINYYKCFQSLLGFTEKIVISYALIDNKGNKNFPSNIYKNFVSHFERENNLNLIEKPDINLLNEFDVNEILALLSLQFISRQELLKSFYTIEDGKLKNIIYNILKFYYNENFEEQPDDKIDTRLINVNKFTASNLENYFSCSNRFLFKEILKLNKFETLKLDAKILGNIVHDCCYIFGQKLINKHCLTQVQKVDIINGVVKNEKYKIIYSIENSKQLIENLKGEILKLFDFILYEQEHSELKITKVEYKFEYKVDNINFKGFVDRIDETETEFIVIDYKTGNTKIEYADIVFNKKVQLLLYSFILEKILNKKCVGIYYLNINDDFSKQNKLKMGLNGITINENNAIYRLDNSIKIDKVTKSNSFDFKEKFLLTTKEFDKLKNYTYTNVINAIKEIFAGNFGANPIVINNKEVCEYCDFFEICKSKNLKVLEFNEDMIKEILND